MFLVGVFPTANAQNYTLSFTARQETSLDFMRDVENEDRLERGVPEQRFCNDDPLVCAQPSTLKYLQARVESLINSFNSQIVEERAKRIRNYCRLNPDDVDCVAVEDKAQ